jgi:hypothetical protein
VEAETDSVAASIVSLRHPDSTKVSPGLTSIAVNHQIGFFVGMKSNL